MAPSMKFTSSSIASRSNSTPNLAALPTYQYDTAGHQANERSLGREFNEPPFDPDFKLDSFTTDSTSKSQSFTVVQPADGSTTDLGPGTPPPARRRTGSLMDKSRGWFPLSKSSTKEAPPATLESPTQASTSPAKTSGSLASFAKRSWLSSSSSSTSPSTAASVKSSSSKLVGSRRPGMATDREAITNRISEPTRGSQKPLTRATSYFSKMKAKQPAAERLVEVDSGNDSSAASDGTSTTGSQAIFSPKASPDDSISTPTDDSFGEQTAQPKDPLWPAFKSMEMDFSIFTTKSPSQKVLTIKTTFLPFLQTTANHWSTKRLHPEDLDRRTQVLNMWWIEMLDMLEGTAVLKVDRPILYEALANIMMRLEWRLTTSHFLSLADRSLRETLRNDSWGKGQSTPSDPDKPTTLVEAAERNVRTTFISNVVRQVVFVVEKASLRYAPLPLMTLVGQTCAYAFFFIPGFAEILASQWNISQHHLKRTAYELGIPATPRRARQDTFDLFPPELLKLTWSTPRSMYTLLRQQHDIPSSMPGLSWAGHWTPRWRGLDTELFFIFCKYFHILSNDFVPPDLPISEKAQSPAFVLVQAQLLLSIDGTLHRRSDEVAAANAQALTTKGSSLMDPFSEPDAAALALSVPPSDFSILPKSMSENAVIVLLKGILFDSSADQEGARLTFAETFSRLLAGAVRKTSLYDSYSCFTLCDFLEESMAHIDEFTQPKKPGHYDNWPFWLGVFKKMLLSLNTVTEVRVLGFIFSIWNIITRDPERKAALCIEWLLSEDVFFSFYTHWCPLVRGYYQRLLCWRICRFDGDPSELDLRIYNLAAQRLKTVWSHYLYLKQVAEQEGRFPPSTAAMLPTPGKKFMIIRLEPEPTRSIPFQTFEQISRSTGAELIYGDDEIGPGPGTVMSNAPKKKKSLFDKMVAFSAQVGHTPVPPPADGMRLRQASRIGSWDEESKLTIRDNSDGKVRSPPLANAPNLSALTTPGTDSSSSQGLSQESVNPFRFILAPHEPVGLPEERELTTPQLPLLVQDVVQNTFRFKPRGSSLAVPSSVTWPPAPNQPPPPPPPSGLISAIDQLSFQEKQDFEVAHYDDDPCLESGLFLSPPERDVEDLDGQASKPLGVAARNAVYSGRSLAEWAQVVSECNHFAERRQQEGILSPKDIEVPTLIVDGFQGIGG